MATVLLKNNITSQTNVLVITEKFKNEFGLPEKVENYINEQLKKDDVKVVQYNYIGKLVSVFIIDSKLKQNDLNEKLRKHAATFCDALNSNKLTDVYIYNQTKQPNLSLCAAEGLCLANYQFVYHKSNFKKTANTLKTIIVANTKINQTQIDHLNIVCQANFKARNLVNEPVNKLNATDLSNAFKQMGKEAGFKVEVYNKTKIKQLKMGGLLSVNAGSVDEPTFTIMEYKSSKAKNKKPYVLVGKGVVYDTGGLSLKPTAGSMDSMKCDMAGAAAVSCAMYAIAKAKLNVHVIALVPATDNRPGFNAFAPGDIITMMDGSTVEMLNSDAEGRMILADALHFAKKYNPELVIDMATLTGAALAAIGSFAMVGMGTANDNVKKKLHETGFAVNERIAEFPFWDDYNDLLKSDIADQKNIGGPYGGSITAGKFLQKFTNYPYFHLDIAGPAFIAAKDSYRGKGGTGWGVRFLFEFFKTI
ncbi:MAG: leucyl aminopeptidase [Bacteroidetes bacterium]|nr:leucyl aminopeptidase [Bacteroidota bacterium]